MKKKFRNPGESYFASRSKRKEQKNQQTLIDTTENCSNDEINIDCGCENTSSIIATEHSYCKLESANVCLACVDKSNLMKSLVKKIHSVSLTVKKQKCNKLLNSKQSRFSWKKGKTAAKMNFSTGLSSIEVFSVVFNLIEPYLPSISYWVGPYRMRRQQKLYRKSYSKVRQYKNHQFKRKLSHKDEFFLTLMRLRLGLLNEDIADRSGFSPTLSSRLFTT